jgi:hypothetical protein
VNEKELVGFWIADSLERALKRPFEDDLARAIYSTLSEAEVLQSDQIRFPDGHTMQCDVGVSGPFAFQFTCATTGFSRLAMYPRGEAARLKPRFDW